MSKTPGIVMAVLACLIAIAIPVLVSIHLARQESLNVEMERVLNYARDVLRRSERTADQAFAGVEKLRISDEPCSDSNLALMREIDLSSSEIQAIGYVTDDRLMCSSLGRHGKGLPLGPAEVVGKLGSLRINVELPIAKGSSFVVLERASYAVIVHKSLPIDISAVESDVSLATYTPATRKVFLSRGIVKPAWVQELHGETEARFFDGEYVVGVAESKRYGVGAVAALPATYVEKRSRDVAVVLVPIGIAGGIALALAVLYIAKLQLSLPAVIRTALRRNEFYLEYQPVVDLRTRAWVGAEALIRWRRASGERVRPDVFIPVAEDAGLIQGITERVLQLVARDARDLLRQHPNFHIAINLSPADLQSKRTLELLRRLVHDLGTSPRNIHVEATERGFLNTDPTREVVREIRSTGIGVAIDDFGTGYSSLSYLETFEFDYLKIDKSFVDTVATDAATSHVVLHVIEMAKSLNLKMVAEGVETDEQARFLCDRGVQYAQGWLFAKSMPIGVLARSFPKNAETSSGPHLP